jgi:hypothetical protein
MPKKGIISPNNFNAWERLANLPTTATRKSLIYLICFSMLESPKRTAPSLVGAANRRALLLSRHSELALRRAIQNRAA